MNHFTSRRSLCALLLAAGAAPGAMAADAASANAMPKPEYLVRCLTSAAMA